MGNQRFSITPAAAVADERITDSIYRTLAAIGLYGDQNGWCWPSQSTLAELRGVSRQTINTHIKILTGLGYLNIAPRFDEETGAQKSNAMQLKFDHDFTGGVKPMALQGVSNSGLDTGCKPQDLTHNAPINAPIKQNKYIEPDPDEIAEIKTAISQVVKTAFWDETREQYDSAAWALYGWNATTEQIMGFSKWWQEKGNYDGLPALKSLVNEWRNYITPAAVSANGKHKRPVKLVDEFGEYLLDENNVPVRIDNGHN